MGDQDHGWTRILPARQGRRRRSGTACDDDFFIGRFGIEPATIRIEGASGRADSPIPGAGSAIFRREEPNG